MIDQCSSDVDQSPSHFTEHDDDHSSQDPPGVTGTSGGSTKAGVVPGGGRKKRRSWKHHKVDAAELNAEHGGGRHGDMYACDQCDKMFGKQSSLARHKYEHSGMLDLLSTSLTLTIQSPIKILRYARLEADRK